MPASAVVLDANLLVLLVVGVASGSYIAKHKRLRAYTENDYTLLTELLSTAPNIIVTPNVVTETSNLAAHIAEPARSHIHRVLRTLLKTTEERYVESKLAAEHVAFIRLGITDAAILDVLSDGHTLLTADLDLYLEALRHGHKAVNFIHHIEANRMID
jgi:hypothetical protein